MTSRLILLFLLAFSVSCAPNKFSEPTTVQDSESTQIIGGEPITLQDRMAQSTVFMKMCKTKNVCVKLPKENLCRDMTECYMCTGFIISEGFIVTGGHCLNGYKKEELEVIFSPDARQADTDHDLTKIFKVAEFRIHPNFKPYADNERKKVNAKNRYDIGLIKIDGKMPADYKPVPVLKSTSGLGKGQMTTIVGYGISDRPNMKGAGQIRKTQIPILDVNYTGVEALLDQRAKKGMCPGDSGGPLFVNVEGVPHVWSISTGTIPKEISDKCDYKATATKVAPFISWIRGQIDILD